MESTLPNSELIWPDWPAPARVKAVCTTRLGGASLPPFDSFNIAEHVGDAPQIVRQNRATLARMLNLSREPRWLEQTHSTKIVDVDRGDINAQADASFTRQPNQVCVVMTADCLPLLLSNSDGTQVAAVHAGWRGLADGIIENAVRCFAQQDSLMAWLGPCIGPQAFEVGKEVRTQLGGPAHCYISHDDPKKVYADLSGLAKTRLSELGVQQIYQSELCTFADQERFFSYRRDGQTGRMASLIWIEA